MKRLIAAAGLVLVFAARAPAQVDDIRHFPGYVNLECISVPDSAGKIMDVTIGPQLMRLVHGSNVQRGAASMPDARRIVSLQVKSFEVDAEAASQMKPALLQLERKLMEENWRPVIRLKSPDRLTHVSVKYGSGRKMDGFFIMTVNPGAEASFVNIVGDVDPDRLKGMLVNVNEGILDSLRKSLEEHRRVLERMKGEMEKAKNRRTAE